MNPYEPPAPREPAPVDSIVADGLLVADAVVRMTLRNHVIVAALRDRVDLDREELARIAAREFTQLADQEREGAERQQARSERLRIGEPVVDDPVPGEPDWREGSRRLTIRIAMAQSYAERAAEPALLLGIVERAIAEAWDEVAAVLVDRMGVAEVEIDERYYAELEERRGALVAFDLSALAAERGVVLD